LVRCPEEHGIGAVPDWRPKHASERNRCARSPRQGHPATPARHNQRVQDRLAGENGSPDVLRYEDVPDPECSDGRVLIDVEAISIEGGDLLARAGSPPQSDHVAAQNVEVPRWRQWCRVPRR
jgi:hypothetical protein